MVSMPTRSRNWTACLCLRRDPGSRGSLSFLFLDSNNISDITPLSGLFNLDELYLAGNPIFNLGALVANAENGGLGPGDTVTLSQETLLDANGETSPIIADQLSRLIDAGVDVVFVEFQ